MQTHSLMTKGSGGSSSTASNAEHKNFSDAAHDTSQSSQSNANDITEKPALSKWPSNSSFLAIPAYDRRPRSQSTDTLSLISNDDFSELRHAQSNLDNDDASKDEGPLPLANVRDKLNGLWNRNKGLVWVILSQIFGVLMNVSARLLEFDENGGMHPFQILFVRMSATCLLSMMYMYYTSTPDFPLGAKGIRWLLVIRGTGGFFGVFGMYSSLQYLPLSDATVLTFLSPILTCLVCSKLLHEPFTWIERIGALVSFAGVVMIARPSTLFSSASSKAPAEEESMANATSIAARAVASETPSHRLLGVGLACVGVLGATAAYVTIRSIGKRAHPLISVNYFAVLCLFISTMGLIFTPSVSFVLPSTPKQWGLLFIIAIGGFILQFLLTAGLRHEKGSRATNMIYTQMLFALAADKVIWNDTPGPWSLAGSSLILGSALVVAVQKAGSVKSKDAESGTRDEEAAIVEGVDAGDEVELPPIQRRPSNRSE